MAAAMRERSEIGRARPVHARPPIRSTRGYASPTACYSDIINRLTNAQTRAAGGRSTILTPVQRDALARRDSRRGERHPHRRSTPAIAACTCSRAADNATPPYTAGPPISAYQGDANVSRSTSPATAPCRSRSTAARCCRGARRPTLPDARGAGDRGRRPATWPASISGLVDVGQAFDRVTDAQTRVGIELARLPRGTRASIEPQPRRRRRRSQAEDASLAEGDLRDEPGRRRRIRPRSARSPTPAGCR